jgi:uncharacterized protein
MRVVIDTNVLISGLFWDSGPPRKIIQAWLSGKVSVIASQEIVDEYRGSTARLSERRKVNVAKLLEQLLIQVHYVSPARLPSQVCRDSEDDIFIAVAFSGRAKYLVSGDAEVLRVRRFRRVKIVSPASFLRILSK